MKNLILFFTIFIVYYQSTAQKNFSKAFTGGHRATVIANAILDNNTVVAYGEVFDSTWGAWFIRMDTSSSLLKQTQFEIDPFPEFFASDNGWSLIKTQDGGYAFIGNTYFLPNSGVLFKLHHEGKLDFVKYYPIKDNAEIVWYPRLIEHKTGYYILTVKVDKKEIYRYSTLIKTDKKGDIIWEKKFPNTQLFDGIIIKNDSTILLYGGEYYQSIGKPNYTYIDSNGIQINKLLDSLNHGGGHHF